jgi:hypothetical protein
MSLASPHHENPDCLALAEDGKATSPATSVITEARSDITPWNSSLLLEVPAASSTIGTCSASPLLRSTEGKVRLPEAIARRPSLEDLPNEVLFHVMGFLDVNDLLSTSRVSSHHLLLATTQSTP